MLKQIQHSAEKSRQLKFHGAKDNLEANFYQGIPAGNEYARDQIRAQMESIEKKHEDDKLQAQIDLLKAKQKELINERDITITKYEESEAMWTKKFDKLSNDYHKMIELNTGLKDDNKDLMIQIDKYIKRVK